VLRADRIHLADHESGCRGGRFPLIRAGVPPVAGQPSPDGYGYDTTTPLPSPDPIAARYAVSGDASGPLGAPTGERVCGLRNDGCRGSYAHGVIAWSPATGARIVSRADIRAAWEGSFGEMGPLGFPAGDTVCGLPGDGCRQDFETGSVYWSPSTGARVTVDPVRDRWRALGGERSAAGYPTTDTVCGLRDNGCFQFFQGRGVYWTTATGARLVYGAIYDRWAAQGWETGVLGYPTTDPVCGLRGGGCYQVFQGGSVYWTAATGAQVVRGAIRDRWAARGWERGWLGYPTTSEFCGLRGGGCGEHFQGGSVYWTPGTGAHSVPHAVRDRWAAAGWENGHLGYPTSEAYPVTGGVAQRFQGGTLTIRGARLP
jgi:uncharacterized protein with LGFP repeats